MSKKMMLALLAAAFTAAPAFAGSQNEAGCGVGALIFKENNAVHQVLAATTNGCFGNQTFGITTGTLGCNAKGNLQSKIQQEQKDFYAANFRNLSREMAEGRGEYLSSLSDLLGCSREELPAFGKLTQEKYDAIVPKDAAPTTSLESLKTQLKASKLSCSQV